MAYVRVVSGTFRKGMKVIHGGRSVRGGSTATMLFGSDRGGVERRSPATSSV